MPAILGHRPNFLSLILLAALIVRVVFALNTDSIDHADEIFQYWEQAHRLAFGYGYVPWEYHYGIRSWIVPGFLAAIMKAAQAFGHGGPGTYVPLIKIILCTLSLSVPWSMYKIAQKLFDEAAARLALLFGAFWYELIYFAHKPLPDALAADIFYAAMALLLISTGRAGKIVTGTLLAFTLAVRFQTAPMVGLVILLAIWRWRGGAVWMLAAFACVMLASGALDAYTWGVWFSSIINNVIANYSYHVADSFGRRPFVYYSAYFLISSFGLALVAMAALCVEWRKSWPLLLLGAASLLVFMAVGHKEARFVFILVPIEMIGLAVGVEATYRRLRAIERCQQTSLRAYAQGFVAVVMLVSAAGASYRLPWEGLIYNWPLVERKDLVAAMLWLSRQDDVTGVIDDSGVPWWQATGYYRLHQDVALYTPGFNDPDRYVLAHSPPNFASHWILRPGLPMPPGYAPIATIGSLTVARVIDPPAHTLVAPSFTREMPPTFNLPIKVTPRW